MIKENISLKSYNTFGVDVKARFFSQVQSLAALQDLLHMPLFHAMPKLVLGGGSNLLFTQDFQGLIIKIEIPGINKIAEDEQHIWLEVGGGENWHELVLYCLANNYAGVENLSLIPGTVGAAPLQNIGAYGVELEKVFDRLTAVRMSDGAIETFDHRACQFGYRDSIFKNQLKNQYIISTVCLRLNKKPLFHTEYGLLQQVLQEMQVSHLDIKAISEAVIKIRTEKLPDPKKIGNAGSFFKNPIIEQAAFKTLIENFPSLPYFAAQKDCYKIPAAWLIEQCGWKGHRAGDAGVHTEHSLVLVNHGNGSGLAIKNLAQEIQNSVREKFNLELIPEVNIY